MYISEGKGEAVLTETKKYSGTNWPFRMFISFSHDSLEVSVLPSLAGEQCSLQSVRRPGSFRLVALPCP